MDASHAKLLMKAYTVLKEKKSPTVEFAAEEAELKTAYLKWLRKAAKYRRRKLVSSAASLF